MDFRTLLRAELAARCARNSRYSARAFARQLGTEHTAIVRIVNGSGRLTARRIAALGARLGLDSRAIAGAVLHEQMERIVRLVPRSGFVPNARWIATRAGLSLQDVQIALHYLVHTRRLTMASATSWTLEPVP